MKNAFVFFSYAQKLQPEKINKVKYKVIDTNSTFHKQGRPVHQNTFLYFGIKKTAECQLSTFL